MKQKINAVINIVLIAGSLGLLTVLSLFKEDRKFSENENRLLEQKPEFTVNALLDGEYTKDYETYVTDQFIGRDELIAMKTYSDICLGKKDIKGVYLGKDHYLLEKHVPDSVRPEKEEERLKLLAELQKFCRDRDGEGTFRVLLVPTADEILKDKLPANAPVYDQSAFLRRVRDTVGDEDYVDAEQALRNHKEEYIYYRTDHHWTTLGAYYGYCAWAESMGIRPLSQEEFRIRTVTDSFLGTLHSKINISVPPDEIRIYEPKKEPEYRVYYDLSDEAKDTLYEEKHLDTKNKYGFFLDDNHALIEIDTNVNNGKELLIVKDSYSNCMVPFLAMHYDKIYVLDLRFYRSGLYDMIEKDTDVLVLYNVHHFLEEFQYF